MHVCRNYELPYLHCKIANVILSLIARDFFSMGYQLQSSLRHPRLRISFGLIDFISQRSISSAVGVLYVNEDYFRSTVGDAMRSFGRCSEFPEESLPDKFVTVTCAQQRHTNNITPGNHTSPTDFFLSKHISRFGSRRSSGCSIKR